jgi:hypothetical protein
MYQCKQCGKTFDLSTPQYSIIVMKEKEVKVSCPCGKTSIIVGGEMTLEGFQIYSRDFGRCWKFSGNTLENCGTCEFYGDCESQNQMELDKNVIE